jgi:hypothetical protein
MILVSRILIFAPSVRKGGIGTSVIRPGYRYLQGMAGIFNRKKTLRKPAALQNTAR